MKTIIKWPGGKSREVDKIQNLIPAYDRYIEPFFGGGAVFFHLQPGHAVINDISPILIRFYRLVKAQDRIFYDYLISYHDSFQSVLTAADTRYEQVKEAYLSGSKEAAATLVASVLETISLPDTLIFDKKFFQKTILKNVLDKFSRTRKNNEKQPFSDTDLKENLLTGFTNGFYMYFRDVYNDLALHRIEADEAYTAANFYFIREYCYGSMFRYNTKGEFNIPYGGISYNHKDFLSKVNAMFTPEIKALFSNTEIYNLDFEKFFASLELTKRDFVFLDPPYDTEFSDYEGRDFTRHDQTRLAETLKQTKAQFILIIKNTDFIYNLYKDYFRILSFDKNYTYNVRSRNDRNVEHLIITNIPETCEGGTVTIPISRQLL